MHCDIVALGNEWRAALANMPALNPGDALVYDRSYYSVVLLYPHYARGLYAVFRLKSNANTVFAAFIAGWHRRALVSVEPSD